MPANIPIGFFYPVIVRILDRFIILNHILFIPTFSYEEV